MRINPFKQNNIPPAIPPVEKISYTGQEQENGRNERKTAEQIMQEQEKFKAQVTAGLKEMNAEIAVLKEQQRLIDEPKLEQLRNKLNNIDLQKDLQRQIRGGRFRA